MHKKSIAIVIGLLMAGSLNPFYDAHHCRYAVYWQK